MRRLRGLIGLFGLMMLLWAAPALAENRALLLGCDHFLTQEDTSPASRQNVEQMTDALSGGRMDLQALVTRRDGPGSAEELEELIAETFSEAREGDVSYFYISTHGLWEEGMEAGDFTLLLSDGKHEEGVTAAWLKDRLDAIPGTKVLILDACHSGAVIGKGVSTPIGNLFAGTDYQVLCSSGGDEDSWFWADGAGAGAGYFSGALARGISAAGHYGADANRDGIITLREARRYLRLNHGESCAQSYPEESAFPLLTYEPEGFNLLNGRVLVDAVAFESGALSLAEPAITLHFTVLETIRLAYRVVYQREGRWDFENADFFWDAGDDILGGAGWLIPGFRERTVALRTEEGDYGAGYVLVQLVAFSGDRMTVVASHALCLPPAEAEPRLSVTATAAFAPGRGEEAALIVAHECPCEMTVLICDAAGRPVRRLVSREPTRPEQLNPNASTYTWNGWLADGSPAPAGTYRIRAEAVVGDLTYPAAEEAEIILLP